jgi:hypothetical protein
LATWPGSEKDGPFGNERLLVEKVTNDTGGASCCFSELPDRFGADWGDERKGVRVLCKAEFGMGYLLFLKPCPILYIRSPRNRCTHGQFRYHQQKEDVQTGSFICIITLGIRHYCQQLS